MAKPSLFTEELFERMLDLHTGEETGEPMTVEDICRLPGMPKTRTFYDWLDQNPELEKRFRVARKVAMDAVASRTRRTARGKGAEEGGDSTGDVQRDKLIIEQDNKLLSKWDTARYGDKVQHADADGGKLPTTISIELVRPK
jgi:hypothetical protein